LVWLVAEQGAAQRIPGKGQRDADQQRQRTAVAAAPRSALAQGDGAEKRIRGQPGTGARWRKPARGRLRGGDGGCPQERFQRGRVTERRCAGVPLGGAPVGCGVKRPKVLTCLPTPLPHSGPPWTNA
jgi:hypothetical protein